MIILTKRQKEILSILLRISNGTTIKQLEESVNVSRRTIYREFNELKLDLERRGLTISNIDGKIVLELLPEAAPNTVNSFIYAASRGFMDHHAIQRIVPGNWVDVTYQAFGHKKCQYLKGKVFWRRCFY